MYSRLEVPYSALYKRCSYRYWTFRYASQVAAPVDTIGQDKALEALDMGLSIGHPFYNIYITGADGTGKVKNTLKRVKEFARKGEDLRDWCYVYNFREPNRPAALSFKPGGGSEFKMDIRHAVENIKEQILGLSGSKTFQWELKYLLTDYSKEKGKILEQLKRSIGEDKFLIRIGEEGIILHPVREGKVITKEEYRNLDEEQREDIARDIDRFYEDIIYSAQQLRSLEEQYRKRLMEVRAVHVKELVDRMLKPLYERYSNEESVLGYLQDMQRDIIHNFPRLLEEEEFAARYDVNLLVDNSNGKGSPVILETNPTIRNLVGQMEFDSVDGTLYTDFMMLRAGSLHKAVGGFLIIPVKELLLSYGSWSTLKLCLEKGEVDFRYSGYVSGNLPIATLYPHPIPLKLKVILIGEEETFHYLARYDHQFEKLFRVKVDYQQEVDRTPSTELEIARYVGYQVKANNMKDFHRSAVAALIQFSSRMAGDQRKLHTGLDYIFDLMVEAEACALRENNDVVKASHVRKALRLRDERSNIFEGKTMEKYRDNVLLLNVEGNRIGEINGVALTLCGDCCFGRVLRITASCYKGDGGIINIEREVRNSGSIHTKGSLVIEGYLMERYGADGMPGITINICYEQFYDHINEDSLAAAELLAAFSVLGEIPLKQSIAVIGSVNQKGELQPVEGINERIEDYFKVCLNKGCREIPGIIIPRHNISQLNVEEEIARAVKRGRFKIYAVEHIEQALGILTGMKTGTKGQGRQFDLGTAGYLIRKRIRDTLA